MNVKRIFFIALASVLLMPTAGAFAKQEHQMHNTGTNISDNTTEIKGQDCCATTPVVHAIATTKDNEKILAPLSLANTRLFTAIQNGSMEAVIASAKELSLAIASIKDKNLKASLALTHKYANALVEATTYSQMRLGYGLLVTSLSSHFVDCGEAPRIHNPKMQDKSAIRGKERRMQRMQMLHYVPDLKVHDATMKNLLSLRLEMKKLRSSVMKGNANATKQVLSNMSTLLFTIDKQNKVLREYTRPIARNLSFVADAKTFLSRLEMVNLVSKELFTMYGVVDMSNVTVDDLTKQNSDEKVQ